MMADKINVLVFPCGSENAIEIHTALKDAVNIELFGASGKEDHGVFIFKNYTGNVPYITSPDFIPFLNALIAENAIDIIIPTHDDISLFLAANEAEIQPKIAVPGLLQATICRSKRRTYELFSDCSFCPTVYTEISSESSFPLFVKPDKGQGGKGAFILREFNAEALSVSGNPDYVVTEFLPGNELTVDCFTDRHGELRFVGPRARNRVFGGISVNTYAVTLSEEIKEMAAMISARIKMRGLWYFQVKQNAAGNYQLLEVSVRTAGSMNLYRALGVNFPLLTVYDAFDYDVSIICNQYAIEVDRYLANRYKIALEYDSVYIDFDDTITKNGKVNPAVMAFLYHQKNRDKKLFLITKHERILGETLDELCIPPGIFDEIIILNSGGEKYRYIKLENNPVFIDNAFKERILVSEKLGIPVFDVDAIPSLMDWRE